jgi:hypothetical protein
VKDLTNSAKRILNLVQLAKRKSDQLPMSEIWGDVFGLDAKLVKEDPYQVYEKLRFLRGELDLLEQLMQDTEFSSSLYEPYIQMVRNTISVTNLTAAWGNYKAYLKEETILAFKYCAEIIPSEPSLEQTDLENILSTINQLKMEIESSSLSNGMHKFLISQLSIVENAIQNYPITGGASIKKAFSEGFTDLVENADNISKASEVDKKVASKVSEVWGAIKVVGKEIVEADRIANAYVKLIDKGHAASDAIIGLLSGP